MSAFEEKPILQGVLWKRAQKSGTNWKKRYFKLFATKLTYSVKENGKEKGRMNFTEEFFVQDGIAPKGKFGFLVTDFVTSHHLATDTKDQKDFWCHAIATVIRKQLELAKYFEEVRKSVKIVDQDLAEKQYQARLDNYYKTVGRPVDKQDRKSVVDFRAAQVLAEATEAARKLEATKEAAEKERLRLEADRLAHEAKLLREVAEKDVQPESITVGAAMIPEEEEDAAESDEEEPDLPPMPPPPPPPGFDDEPALAVKDTPKSPRGAPPPMPPRKNTIAPNQALDVATEVAQSRRPTIQAMSSTDALEAAATPSWAHPGEVSSSEHEMSAPSAPPTMEPHSRRGTMLASPKAADAERKASVAPGMSPRPSVVALAKTFEHSSSASNLASPSRKNTITTQEAEPPAPSRKLTVTAPAPVPPETAPARKQTITSPFAEAPERKLTVTTATSSPPISSPSQASPVAQAPPAPLPSPVAQTASAASAPIETAKIVSPPSQSTAPAPKASNGIASKLGIWQNKVDSHLDKQASNVFSGSYQGKGAISKEHYGKAPEGSKTEERAKAAADWVEQEIDKLVKVILEMGTYDPQEGGIKTVQFGPLFYKYADISDTLVGILMRAKKRKRLMYQGDMLFQNMHDHVKITVLQA